MFRLVPGLFYEREVNAAGAAWSRAKCGRTQPEVSRRKIRLRQPDLRRCEQDRLQQVALPQRALLIFSRSVSTPTAPITTCLPIT